MRILVTGATGQIGRRLVAHRLAVGDEVAVLSRDAGRASAVLGNHDDLTVIAGNPAEPGAWQRHLAGFEAVINLAGANIADRRWTATFKRTIASSRIDSTRNVIEAIRQAAPADRPTTLVNASATGYYGDAGDRQLDEQSPAGTDFLARVCTEWEQEARRAIDHGVRVVLLRSGAVLDPLGGALKKLMLPFKLFAGGPIGSGEQFLPWIHWRDAIGLIDLALDRAALEGPLNGVAPESVRQREFASELAAALNRPCWLPAPRPLLRLALGEMADALTASQCIVPERALSLGYRFEHPKLEGALRSLLGLRQNP